MAWPFPVTPSGTSAGDSSNALRSQAAARPRPVLDHETAWVRFGELLRYHRMVNRRPRPPFSDDEWRTVCSENCCRTGPQGEASARTAAKQGGRRRAVAPPSAVRRQTVLGCGRIWTLLKSFVLFLAGLPARTGRPFGFVPLVVPLNRGALSNRKIALGHICCY